MKQPISGKLFLVSTPIGNAGDITLRALEVLKAADLIVCEEIKEGRRLLAVYNLNRDTIPLNEHNEETRTDEILASLRAGNAVALISDAGAPLIADPGTRLVQRCIELNIPVTSVPGANSILPALQLSGFSVASFLYVGWLSPKKEVRRNQLRELKEEKRLLVILEAPYRVQALLRDASGILGTRRQAAVAFDLTTDKETIYRDTLGHLASFFERNPRKGEFVLIIKGDDHHL
jgi:16S rRNA (cytidine1402-2'-O)-methyltransferase